MDQRITRRGEVVCRVVAGGLIICAGADFSFMSATMTSDCRDW
jgi:hypothetical protein